MLEKIKTLMSLTTEDKDEILQTLISICKDEATDFCNLDEYNSKLDSAVIYMVIERYNRIGSEGVAATSVSGISESFEDGYSNFVMNKLKKNRKLRCL
jgi:Phage gp6-like head-tail connector protein